MKRLQIAIIGSLFALGVIAGCQRDVRRGPTVSPAQNITGTYELKGFNLTTTPGTGGPGQEAGTFIGNLKIGGTVTEKNVASYSGTLKIGRNSWSYQVSINGRVKSESGDYTLNFTSPNRAIAIVTTPTEKSARQIELKDMEITVTHDATVLQDGSTLREVYTWRKISDAL